MKSLILLLTGTAWASLYSVALADDHLYEALEHGLTAVSQPFQTNPAGTVAI
jgi:hypothetical protein